MRWIHRYRISSFVRSALWLVPIISLSVAVLLTPLLIAATFLRDRPVKFTFGLVVFPFMLSIGVPRPHREIASVPARARIA
jgi:uncharacterized membrane protein